MKNYLKINENLIIREEDKMLFSAKNMQIYKFNEKGYEVVKIINSKGEISEEELLSLLKEKYTEDEIKNLINKMVKNNIIELYEK